MRVVLVDIVVVTGARMEEQAVVMLAGLHVVRAEGVAGPAAGARLSTVRDFPLLSEKTMSEMTCVEVKLRSRNKPWNEDRGAVFCFGLLW